MPRPSSRLDLRWRIDATLRSVVGADLDRALPTGRAVLAAASAAGAAAEVRTRTTTGPGTTLQHDVLLWIGSA